jgi:GNAT superfamily N-acetyltransferase
MLVIINSDSMNRNTRKTDRISIRHAERNDYQSIINLLIAHAKFHAKLLPHYFKAGQSRNAWLKYVSGSDDGKISRIFVAVSRDKIIGILFTRIEKQSSILSRQKYLGLMPRMYVASGYRNKGVGRMLFREAIKWLKHRHVHLLMINSVAKNTISNRAWKSYGLKIQSYRLEMRI